MTPAESGIEANAASGVGAGSAAAGIGGNAAPAPEGATMPITSPIQNLRDRRRSFISLPLPLVDLRSSPTRTPAFFQAEVGRTSARRISSLFHTGKPVHTTSCLRYRELR